MARADNRSRYKGCGIFEHANPVQEIFEYSFVGEASLREMLSSIFLSLFLERDKC